MLLQNIPQRQLSQFEKKLCKTLKEVATERKSKTTEVEEFHAEALDLTSESDSEVEVFQSNAA